MRHLKGRRRNAVTKTEENPQTAADQREAYERRNVYPRFIMESESEGNEDAVRAFPSARMEEASRQGGPGAIRKDSPGGPHSRWAKRGFKGCPPLARRKPSLSCAALQPWMNAEQAGLTGDSALHAVTAADARKQVPQRIQNHLNRFRNGGRVFCLQSAFKQFPLHVRVFPVGFNVDAEIIKRVGRIHAVEIYKAFNL